MTGYDGAMWTNAAINPAMQESLALEAEYNPHRTRSGTQTPSFLLSLGTGMAQPGSHDSEHSWTQWLSRRVHGRTIGRLVATAKKHTTGRVFWDEFASKHTTLVEEGKAWRFEPSLPADLLRLDNPQSIPRLIALTNEEFAQWPHKETMAAAIVANMFRFQLDSTPTFAAGRVVVRGRVASTWGPPVPGVDDNRDEFDAWSRLLQNRQLRVIISKRYQGTIRADLQDRWNCPVTVALSTHVRSLRIEVRDSMNRTHDIYGSPYTLDGLMDHRLDFLPSEDNFDSVRARRGHAPTSRKRVRSV